MYTRSPKKAYGFSIKIHKKTLVNKGFSLNLVRKQLPYFKDFRRNVHPTFITTENQIVRNGLGS